MGLIQLLVPQSVENSRPIRNANSALNSRKIAIKEMLNGDRMRGSSYWSNIIGAHERPSSGETLLL